MNNPLVTISIPTYNSGSFLKTCLVAIKEQTYSNIEVNIIDGGSIDDTVKISRSFGIEPIFSGALLGARYEGFKSAKGDYVLLLDSDQILEVDAIERAIKQIQSKDLDMLVLEEDVYRNDNLIEKLFHYDWKLIHAVKDFDPYTSVMLPRFYKVGLLEKAFSNIPTDLFKTVGGPDHANLFWDMEY